MVEMVSWLGNIFLVVGFILVARQNKYGQLLNAFGCTAYLIVGILSHLYAMVFLELFLMVISIIGYTRWKK